MQRSRPTPSTSIGENTYQNYVLGRSEELNKRLKGEIRELESANSRLHQRIELLERIDSIVPSAPKWTRIRNSSNIHTAMPTLMLSDCHFDEVVNADEVEGVNEYNRQIAIKRLRRVLSGTIDMARKYISGVRYEGFTLLLGGDLLSGNIHEELEQTNEDTVLGSLDFWADQLLAFIGALVDEFKHLHIAGVVGNHGRLTRKPRAKLRVRDNLDWLLYRIVARALQKDSRITWQIPESADCTVKQYDTILRFTHGDQFRGGSGIAGMLSPLMLGHHRKSQRQMSIGKPYQHLIMGHWHTYFTGMGLVVNGSLKGVDEWAYLNNFKYERPQQAFWLCTPQQGITFPVPIFGTDGDRNVR